MAIWHYRVNLVPSERFLDIYGVMPSAITEDEIVSLNPWQNTNVDLRNLDNVAAEGASWSDEIRIWGHEETNNISVIFKNHEISWITAAIDLRGDYKDFINKITAFAQDMNCVFFLNGNACIPADSDTLMCYIRDSLAYKFVANPRKALEDLNKDQ
jgi:hypothetical protein